MTPNCRRLHAFGIGLGLLGSLLVVASMVLVGGWVVAVLGLGSTVTLVFCLRNVFEREDFERDHSLANRLANWTGATVAFTSGLVVLAAGIVAVVTFG
ncbi:hypothetical protein VB773_12605 [Haloarculaceae archaeon H-GB2-1]|nr:hypothetical protein [Haloarculaceae archaeon H-GB1-1]MEA5408314.1 hypothetical protein [Haloarculaceae archaeon H-GB2-1]